MIFIATFKDGSGTTQVQEITATDVTEARRKLRRMGISPKDATLTIKRGVPNQSPQKQQRYISASEIKKSEDKLIIEWARSMGYPVPEPRVDLVSAVFLVFFGFVFCFIPGVLAFIFVAQRNGAYVREMAALRTKWVDAGQPKPGEKGVSPGNLEVLPENKAQKTTEQKLDEIKVLRERGQISDEEYEKMRKNILGL